MTMHASEFSRGVKRFFASLNDRAGADQGEAAGANATAAQADPGNGTRAQLIQSVAAFFNDYDVHVTGRRLMLVHDMLADAGSDLGKRYLARLKSPLAINDAWLEALEHEQARQQSAALDKLMGEFEQQLGNFHSQARTAREATENYSGEIESRIDAAQADPSGLAAIAAQVLHHSRELAATLKHNEEDSEKLQRRLAKAKLEAQTDQLTGLPNRRAFEEQFALQCGIARANRQPFCLAFCDIDNFKQVNDRHGHDAGDRVLKKVGETLATLSRQGSFVSRHGGEEFVVMFPATSIKDATAKLDRAREEISAKELRNRDSGELIGRVSFSAGIANVMLYENPRDALQAADAALYRAKHQGKNQVVQA